MVPMQGGANVVSMSQGADPNQQPQQQQTQQQSQPDNQNKPWSVGDPDLDKLISTKGWKDANGVLKSYGDLESKFGKISGENKELMDWYKKMLPHLDDFDAYLLAKEEKENEKAGVKEPSETDKQLAELRKSQEARERSEFDRDCKVARKSALRQFYAEFPDYKSMEDELNNVIQSGRVAVRDPRDSDEIYEMLKTCREVVVAKRADAAERGRRANSLEGGSKGGGSQKTGNGESLDDIREQLKNG